MRVRLFLFLHHVQSILQSSIITVHYGLPLDQRVVARAQPQTPDFSGPLGHWPGACGFLSPSASSHFVSVSFHFLSFGSPPVTKACIQPGPLDMAT